MHFFFFNSKTAVSASDVLFDKENYTFLKIILIYLQFTMLVGLTCNLQINNIYL